MFLHLRAFLETERDRRDRQGGVLSRKMEVGVGSPTQARTARDARDERTAVHSSVSGHLQAAGPSEAHSRRLREPPYSLRRKWTGSHGGDRAPSHGGPGSSSRGCRDSTGREARGAPHPRPPAPQERARGQAGVGGRRPHWPPPPLQTVPRPLPSRRPPIPDPPAAPPRSAPPPPRAASRPPLPAGGCGLRPPAPSSPPRARCGAPRPHPSPSPPPPFPLTHPPCRHVTLPPAPAPQQPAATGSGCGAEALGAARRARHSLGPAEPRRDRPGSRPRAFLRRRRPRLICPRPPAHRRDPAGAVRAPRPRAMGSPRSALSCL